MNWMFILYGVMAAALSVALFLPVKYLAHKFNWLDMPSDRKIHKKPVPRLGGIMIFGSFLIMYLIAKKLTFIIPSVSFYKPGVLVALVSAFCLGLADDLTPIHAYKKLIVQFLIGFVIAYSGLRINNVTIMGYFIDLGVVSYFITALWVVALINAVNLIDGMDGLAAGILIIAMVFTTSIAIMERNFFVTLVCCILTGSLIGFYIFNFPPAKIFMGDCGSYFLGTIYAVISLMGMKRTSMAIMFSIPLVLLIIPMVDVIYTAVRRTKRKNGIFNADKNHIHHRLLNLGFSVRQINFLVYLVCISFGMIALLIALTGGQYGALFFVLILCLTIAGFGVIRILEKR
jgi:UDP-GlcNAc:undecaprenyl-phosphate GlcNAc-1-phosphate transferase